MQEAAFRASDWEGYRRLGAVKRSALRRAHSIASCFERYGIHGGADSTTAPGWASFDVRPQLGSTLHNASARAATPFGHVGMDVTRHEAVATAAAAGGGGGGGDKRLRVRLSVPDGTVARLVLPFSMGRVASYAVEPALPVGAQQSGHAAADITEVGLRIPPGT